MDVVMFENDGLIGIEKKFEHKKKDKNGNKDWSITKGVNTSIKHGFFDIVLSLIIF